METINIQNYRIVKGEKEIRGAVRPIVQIFKATPKGKYQKEKMISNFFYGSVASQEESIAKFIASIKNRAKEQEERKQKKADAKANMVNPFKVGDIVYDSWGYDQTNIDFYQVVEVGKKSVKIREISCKMTTKEGYSDMSGFVSAVKDDFVGEVIQKTLQVLESGKVYIRSRHGWINFWDGQPKYMSWYA